MVYNVNLKKLLTRLRSSAKKRHLEFNLTEYNLECLSFPITCPILHIPIEYNRTTYSPNMASIDRIDNSKGYIKDNIQVISFSANRAKNNLTWDELKLFALYYK